MKPNVVKGKARSPHQYLSPLAGLMYTCTVSCTAEGGHTVYDSSIQTFSFMPDQLEAAGSSFGRLCVLEKLYWEGNLYFCSRHSRVNKSVHTKNRPRYNHDTFLDSTSAQQVQLGGGQTFIQKEINKVF